MASLQIPRPRQNFLPHILKPLIKKADYASLPPITGDYNVGPDYGRKAKRSPSGVFLSGSGNLDEPESRDYVAL